MKNLTYILLLLFVCANCNSEEQDCVLCEISGVWIEKYNYTGKKDTTVYSTKRFLIFHQDSISIRSLGFDNFERRNDITIPYIEDNYKLILGGEGSEDTIGLEMLREDTMILEISEKEYAVYERINQDFKNVEKINLRNLILGNTYEISPLSLEIEFLDKGKFVIDDLNRTISGNHFWKIEELNNEIFLIADSRVGFMWRLISADSQQISFQQYGIENKVQNLIEIESEKKHFETELIGNWEEILRPDLENNQKDYSRDFSMNEKLSITSEKISRHKFSKKNELKWTLNNVGDKILFEDQWDLFENREWNIIKLDQNEMILERRLNRRSTNGEIVETVKYRRKE